jgi:hypothetical protein
MTYGFAKGTPIDLGKLRERLRKMSNDEVRKFGKTAAFMCTPKVNLRKAPGQDFVTQLETARSERKRRMKRP